MALPDFSMRQLLEAGVHFGHQSHRWNPKMAEYIFGTRNNIHIIDLAQSVPMLHRALQAVSDTVANGGRILFVGTKRQAQDAIAEAAKRSAQYYVNSRWLGGTLTNWKTISQSISRLRKLEEMLSSGESRLHQERAAYAAARARQARPRARRHQGHGRPSRPPVRDRYQQGGHRHQGGAPSWSTGRGGGRHQLRSQRHHLSCREMTTRAAPLRFTAILRRRLQSTVSRARKASSGSIPAPRPNRSWKNCRRPPKAPGYEVLSGPRGVADDLTKLHMFRLRSKRSSTISGFSITGRLRGWGPRPRIRSVRKSDCPAGWKVGSRSQKS